jgi:hypothetical protein
MKGNNEIIVSTFNNSRTVRPLHSTAKIILLKGTTFPTFRSLRLQIEVDVTEIGLHGDYLGGGICSYTEKLKY